MDPFEGAANLILGLFKRSATALWLKLLFTMTVGSTVALTFTTGTVALASHSLATGFATGLVAMSLTMVVQFSRSPLTKGLSLYLPTQIVQEAARQGTTEVKGDSK